MPSLIRTRTSALLDSDLHQLANTAAIELRTDLSRRVFSTYGIRNRAASSRLTPSVVVLIVRAKTEESATAAISSAVTARAEFQSSYDEIFELNAFSFIVVRNPRTSFPDAQVLLRFRQRNHHFRFHRNTLLLCISGPKWHAPAFQ
jgi:hypothetical protein